MLETGLLVLCASPEPGIGLWSGLTSGPSGLAAGLILLSPFLVMVGLQLGLVVWRDGLPARRADRRSAPEIASWATLSPRHADELRAKVIRQAYGLAS